MKKKTMNKQVNNFLNIFVLTQFIDFFIFIFKMSWFYFIRYHIVSMEIRMAN